MRVEGQNLTVEKMMKKEGAFIKAAILSMVVLAGAVLSGGLASSQAFAQKTVPEKKQQISLSFAPLVKRVAPTVVNIYAKKVVRGRRFRTLFDDPFFRKFFGEGLGLRFGPPSERVQNSLGSGVIVRPDGVIVTNRHVIEGASQITVALSDRREFEAKVLGVEERTDLAVLKVETKGKELPFLKLEDSDILEVGDLVLAIGNPFGVGQTVTSGIISALARVRAGMAGSYIQTDAAINPGNSGGALIDVKGKLVGINTAIVSKSGGSLGIGFAIPSNMVRSVVVGFADGGRLVRPWMGAMGQEVTPEIADSLGMERPLGVLIGEVTPDSPADRAGLRSGDLIVSVDGHEVNDPQSMNYRIATLPVGGTVDIKILRSQGKEEQLKLSLEEPQETPPRDMRKLDGSQPLAGASVANMSPALSVELGRERFVLGVSILDVRRGSNAARFGFKPGDFVLSVNGEKVSSSASLVAILKRKAERWEISIDRNGKTFTQTVRR
jgi:Do/DeqQ family serine protease